MKMLKKVCKKKRKKSSIYSSRLRIRAKKCENWFKKKVKSVIIMLIALPYIFPGFNSAIKLNRSLLVAFLFYSTVFYCNCRRFD